MSASQTMTETIALTAAEIEEFAAWQDANILWDEPQAEEDREPEPEEDHLPGYAPADDDPCPRVTAPAEEPEWDIIPRCYVL